MNPLAIKLGFVALDQIARWVKVYQAAEHNPDMTNDDADALIRATQAETIQISDDWQRYYDNR